jgi:hypothetical protein
MSWVTDVLLIFSLEELYDEEEELEIILALTILTLGLRRMVEAFSPI